MISRLTAAAIAAALGAVGLASAATLSVAEEPVLDNHVVTVPECGESSGSVPQTWSPSQECDEAEGATSVPGEAGVPSPESTGDVPEAGVKPDQGTSQPVPDEPLPQDTPAPEPDAAPDTGLPPAPSDDSDV